MAKSMVRCPYSVSGATDDVRRELTRLSDSVN